MQAIILAAGMGRRLGEYTKENTKCMVSVNGRPLVDRVLDQLGKHGLRRVVIVVGHGKDNLIHHIRNIHFNLDIEFIENPVYDKTNNIYSLALAKEKMMEDDTLLIESDLIFDDSILDLILNNPSPNLALVAKYESWMDGTMVCIDDDSNIVNFVTKAAFKYSETSKYYKTVNIYKFSRRFSVSKYIPFLEAYTKAVGNNEYYENVLRIISFLNSGDLKALPVSTEKWYEIDDKQDLDIAEALFSDDDSMLERYYSRYGGFWRFPQMLDFCYLVNPYFRKSKIVDELEANFRTLLGEYPSGMRVNSLLASKCWGVKEDFVVPGNGASELIKVLLENTSGKVGVIRPTFEEYPDRLDDSQIEVFIPQNRDFRYDENDLMNHFNDKKISTLLLINPDNPSGNFISVYGVLRLAGWCEERGIRLIVDESFVDFSRQWKTSSLLDNQYLERFPHLVVIKSISKSYGVQGLRLGILSSADTELTSLIKKQVSIWNINSFAEFFMQIYSKYDNDFKRACAKFIEVRDIFESKLRSIPFLCVIPSEANFFLCKVLPPFTASSLALTLLKKYYILISVCSSKKGLTPNGYVRIAVRNSEDNDRLVEALKKISNG